jgi:WD40 repeat protein
MMKLFRRLAWCAAAAAALAPAAARAQIPADAHWRVVTTPHFRVHYTTGLEPLARRAGARAEEAYAEIAAVFVRPPRGGRVDLVVTDNVDFSNGFATPFPRNRVVVFAHPPVDDPSLAYYDDWMQLVITHELTHVFHLDYARGLPRLPRLVFGRTVLGFPNTNEPAWTKEGLAVYLESRLTRAGRIRGTMHEMALRTAILEGRFFPIDRASGDPASWPSGNTSYVYGSMFLDWLSRRYGDEKAREFVRRYGGQVIPFLNDLAAHRAYGIGFTHAWSEWRRELETRYRAQADSLRAMGLTEPEILTGEGRDTQFPRWSPDGRWIAYAVASGREEPSERVVDAERRVRVLASRTTASGSASWAADGRSLLTSMIDLRDPFRYYADLFRIDAEGGRRRLTHDLRVVDPDVARDGRIVAVRSAPGTTVPVVLDRADAAPRDLVPPSLDVQWAYPRWSPDGRRIALSRWREGGFYDVVILDETGRVVAQATDDRAVDSAPAWSPDGRWVLFSSDRTGIANLYAYDTQDGRVMQVTSVLTGAFQPDVSPDGRWIAFQYYRADGYHVARIPFDPATWRPAPPVRDEARAAGAQPDPARAVDGPSHRYWAARSVLPTSWQPTFYSSSDFGTALGVATYGSDVVERHLWGAAAQVFVDDGRFEGGVGYLFRGLGNPSLGVSVSQNWSDRGAFEVTGPDALPDTVELLEREREITGVATFTRPRFRSFTWLSVGANLRDRFREWSDPRLGTAIIDPPADVGAVATLGTSTARAYDFSVSTQDGVLAAATVEGRRFLRPLAGETQRRGYLRLAGRAQAYRSFAAWGFARHVLALRGVGGADFGSRTPFFTAGGVTGDAIAPPLSTGVGLGETRDLFVRGWAAGSQFGDRALAGTAEWRFPLLRVERGLGMVPVFANRFWGTAFVDAGTAWCAEQCDPDFAILFRRPDPLVSVGAELGGDFLFGFNAAYRLRAGIAVPVSNSVTTLGVRERQNPKVYFTFGQAF